MTETLSHIKPLHTVFHTDGSKESIIEDKAHRIMSPISDDFLGIENTSMATCNRENLALYRPNETNNKDFGVN